MNERDVWIRIPEWAQPLLHPARYKSVDGGRGSAKSHTFAQLGVLRMAGLLPEYRPAPIRIASARDFEVNLRESVKVLVEHYIKEYGLDDEFIIHGNSIDHVNGSHMSFPGVTRNTESFLSMEGIDVFWMEQAEHLQNEMTLIDPTIRKRGAERWFSWNPLNRTDWCWRRFKLHPQRDDVILTASWEDNPWWYETDLERTRVYSQEVEPELYQWVWGGLPNDADGATAILTYAALRDCVRAYEAGLAPPLDEQALTHAGFDLAEGGADKCALIIRTGPVLRVCEQWPGVSGDLSQAAVKAREFAEPYDVQRIYYDASSPARTDLLRVKFVGVKPVNFGGIVGGPDVLYEPRRSNKAVFAKRNVQMAQAIRNRANRTVRLLRGDKTIDPEACLFIPPDLPGLEGFLSDCTQPIRRINQTSGRWEMDKRGGDENQKSPDQFDALCLAYAYETDERGLKIR